jgi:hypothetical protein
VPPAFAEAALLFGFQATLFRGIGGFRGDPGLGLNSGLTNERNQTLERVLAVALLGAMTTGFDDKHAILIDPAPSQMPQALPEWLGQVGGAIHREAELYRGATLLTFWPPEPEARMNCQSRSCSRR